MQRWTWNFLKSKKKSKEDVLIKDFKRKVKMKTIQIKSLKWQKGAHINKKLYATNHCRREKELTAPKSENFHKVAH